MKRLCVMKIRGSVRSFPRYKLSKAAATALLLFVAINCVGQAQPGGDGGIQGINEAQTRISGYFDVGTSLIYAIGAVAGLVGAVKVYTKWNNGDQDTMKVASGWFGSCIFLVVVATVLRAFFL